MASPLTGPNVDRSSLVEGLAQLGVLVTDSAVDQLMEFCALLKQWNQSYNLVSAGDISSLVSRHLLDSISIHPQLLPGSLLDVGTGAGFPGLPLAIIDPGLDCTLLDSAGKKVRFLKHVKRTLKLENINLQNLRVQDFEPDRKFDNISSRAFSSLADFAASVRHLAGAETRLLAMKGRYPQSELQGLPQWLQVLAVEKIGVPDLHAERHLVIMSISP